MKTTIQILLVAMAFALSLSAQCNDNCGQFPPGTCGACHIISGPPRFPEGGGQGGGTVWPPPNSNDCHDCSGQADGLSYKPIVPLGQKLADIVGGLMPKPDAKLQRLMLTTPERHIELMQRAARLKLDGAALGPCTHSFRPGTLLLLRGEIDRTRTKLVIARR